MGLYATTTSLDTIMIGLNFDTATTALATKMITHAENEINKYLSKRYDLSSSQFQTSTSIPPLITSLCERLSEGYIWKSNSRGGKESLARGKELVTEVIENLMLISSYKLDLLDSSGSVISDMSNTAFRVLCNTTGYTNTFDEGSELGWVVDPDKLDDIADGRE
jgi:hypothetical protein